MLELTASDLRSISVSEEDIPILLQKISKLKDTENNPAWDPNSHEKEAFDNLQTRQVSTWTTSDVAQFLGGLHLSKYASAFQKSQIDGPKLLQLDNIDLLQLGITSSRKRAQLLRLVRKLGSKIMNVEYSFNGNSYFYKVDESTSLLDLKNQILLKHPELQTNKNFSLVLEIKP